MSLNYDKLSFTKEHVEEVAKELKGILTEDDMFYTINFHLPTVDDVIEDIQEAQVAAGGRFMRSHEIKEMSVGTLLKLLIPNGVEFKIKLK